MIPLIIALLMVETVRPAPVTHQRPAQLAAQAYGHDVDLLLAIAWKETRHRPWLVSATNDCGVMQVQTRGNAAYCAKLAGLAYGYSEGARVLRAWVDVKGNLVDGLGAYACGGRISKRCRIWAMLVTNAWLQYKVALLSRKV